MQFAPSGIVIVLFAIISVLSGVDAVGDLIREGIQPTFNIALDILTSLGAALVTGLCAKAYFRERRVHEEIRHNLLGSLPDCE